MWFFDVIARHSPDACKSRRSKVLNYLEQREYNRSYGLQEIRNCKYVLVEIRVIERHWTIIYQRFYRICVGNKKHVDTSYAYTILLRISKCSTRYWVVENPKPLYPRYLRIALSLTVSYPFVGNFLILFLCNANPIILSKTSDGSILATVFDSCIGN